MALDLPYAHATRVHRDDLVVKAGKAALVLRNQLRFKAAAPISRYRQLHRLVLGQHRLFAIAITAITGLFAFRNLILRRICKMMIHLSVQNSLSQSLLQLPEQSLRGKDRLRILILQQLIDNLVLDRHTLPPDLKYGSDTKNQTLPTGYPTVFNGLYGRLPMCKVSSA